MCPECQERFPVRDGRIDLRYLPEDFRNQTQVRIDTDYEPADPTFQSRIYGGPRLAAQEAVQRIQNVHAAQGSVRILDIGMHLFGRKGFKPYTRALQPLLDLYVAVDPSTWYLPPPGESYDRCHFYQAFGECLPLQDSLFNVVLSTATFDHLFDPDRCLDEIVRVLEPGGLFILQLNNDRSWFKRVFKRRAARLKAESALEHNNFWSVGTMSAQLEAKGFEVLSRRCYRYNPFIDFPAVGRKMPYRLHLELCRLSDSVGRVILPRGGGNFTLLSRTPKE